MASTLQIMTNRGKPEPFTVLDLFCGAGGLSLGLERAGFSTVLAVDHNPAAVATYAANLGDRVLQSEIEVPQEFPSADLIVGGPPCQGFSSAGMRRAGDERNSLIRCFAEIVCNKQPLAFVFENVEGFLTAENGTRVFDLLEPLVECGYRIHLRKVNAANYGVPQHRKRVIAIGGLGWDPTFPDFTHSAFGAPGAHLAASHLPPSPTILECLNNLPDASVSAPGNPSGHFFRPLKGRDLERAIALKPGQTMRDLPDSLWHESYRRRANRRVADGTPTERRGGAPAGVKRLRPDEPSKAITSGAVSEFLHPLENRTLTIRECARIQTFPDEFDFIGTSSQQILLVGNAVPPRLGEVIAKQVSIDLSQVPKTRLPGKLLSFVPTLSEGMSPALAGVCQRVERCFLKDEVHRNQMTLWA